MHPDDTHLLFFKQGGSQSEKSHCRQFKEEKFTGDLPPVFHFLCIGAYDYSFRFRIWEKQGYRIGCPAVVGAPDTGGDHVDAGNTAGGVNPYRITV